MYIALQSAAAYIRHAKQQQQQQRTKKKRMTTVRLVNHNKSRASVRPPSLPCPAHTHHIAKYCMI